MPPTTSTRAFLVDHFRFDAGVDSHNGPVFPRQDLIKHKRATRRRVRCVREQGLARAHQHRPDRGGNWGLSELDTVPLTEDVA
jgi:hypothetical protein